MTAETGDLPYLLITDAAYGGVTRIYFQSDLQGFAESKAACWAGELRLLTTVIPDHRRDIHWASLVFTDETNYQPPRTAGPLRWSVAVHPKPNNPSLDYKLLVTMPHEQVHQSQGTRRPKLPRWFEEGHAEWAGLKVTDAVRPDLAAAERLRRSEALKAVASPRLLAWGAVGVKPEAIRRQLTPTDRERLDKDPTFEPQGPFVFGPGDITTDERDLSARYAAAREIFDGLEQRHGTEAVQAWIVAVLDSPKGDIISAAQTLLGEDLRPALSR